MTKRSRGRERMFAQTTVDASLHAQFEQGGHSFDYSKCIEGSSVEGERVKAYLQSMQRGKEIQPFGCLLVVSDQDKGGFTLLGYSHNAPNMLHSHSVPSIKEEEEDEENDGLTIGMDARALFRPASAAELLKAAASADVQLLNPILVHCTISGKPFYAILHRIDAGLVIDLEPIRSPDVDVPLHMPVSVAVPGALQLQSYKLASRAISRLQCLAGGDIGLLCETVVRDVGELTGYDRVMAYRFHEDDHGEVVAEIRRSDLEPYLGLHYPATDIPQASLFFIHEEQSENDL